MTETPPPVDFIAQANLMHEQGLYVTPPSTLYFTYVKPDGESFVAPATSAEVYLREGFTISGEQTIEDFAAWNAEQAAKAAPKATEAKAEPHASKSEKSDK